MVRHQNWQELLRAFVERNRQRPFRWGSWDCCLFACNAVREITGEDLASTYRGQYHTMLGAFRIVHGSIDNIVYRIAREHDVPTLDDKTMARPGDVVLANVNDLSTLGIVGFNRLALFSSNVGLLELPFSSVRTAWRIG